MMLLRNLRLLSRSFAAHAVLNQEIPPMRSSILASAALAFVAVLMTGCAGFDSGTPVPSQVSLSAMHGSLHGGQQPVTGSTIQLFQSGAAYGTGATQLLTSTVTSDASGNFNLTGKYSCTSGTQLYITATGGNPGLVAGTNNSALAMMAALGPCESLTSNSYIYINEITTVGAVWALNPFMTGTATAATIGSPASNSAGLAAAFSDVAQIANNATGATPGAALPAGAVAPTAEINTLADILAGCINSASGNSAGCAALFTAATPAGGSAPTNTIAAALNIARNPGQNVPALLALALPNSPFQPILATANDLTLGVTYAVGTAPAAVAVDASNNIWVANNTASTVTKLTHAGAPVTYTATTGGINLPTSIAIDAGGNAWVANSNNSLTQITAAGAGSNVTGGGLNNPRSVAIDGLGIIWVANGGATSLSAFNSTGTAIAGSPFAASPANGSGELAVAINSR